MDWVLIAVGAILLLYALSLVREALRRGPEPPEKLSWAPELKPQYVIVDGLRLRYVETGKGPSVVLLHTLRTQLDLFRGAIPELARDFHVYAFDYPGHGYSDIPEAESTPELFARSVRGFLERLDITSATLVGESIGGALALQMAAEGNARVVRVIAINSYNYDHGRGIMRGSMLSWLIFAMTAVPLIGGMVWRMRWYGAFETIIKNSVHDPDKLPDDLVREMHEVGNRRNHYKAFMSLIRHFPEWEKLRAVYGRIEIPVLLVYGAYDWSRKEERDSAREAIPGARFETVSNVGHLLSLEAPEATIRLTRSFAD